MLMEMTAAQFLTGYDCSLYTLGDLEDRHYSFGFRRGSASTRQFSQLLLQLAEAGKISRARDVWWPQPSACSQAGPGETSTSLDLVIMSPLFILLSLAILLSCLLLLLEILSVTDRQISSVPWYLKLRLTSSTRDLESDQVGTNLGQAHAATQTVLWASSRGNTPGRGREDFLHFFHGVPHPLPNLEMDFFGGGRLFLKIRTFPYLFCFTPSPGELSVILQQVCLTPMTR